MNSVIYNPSFYQGDTWNLELSLTQTISGSSTAFDLTNFTAKSQMRQSAASSGTILEFNCATSGSTLTLSAPASATAQVAAGSYAWDVEVSGTSGTASGTVYTVARGYVVVTQGVTR
jgi:hypothetical protein